MQFTEVWAKIDQFLSQSLTFSTRRKTLSIKALLRKSRPRKELPAVQGLLIQLQRSEMGRRLQARDCCLLWARNYCASSLTEWPLNIYLIVSFVGLKLEVGRPRWTRVLTPRSWLWTLILWLVFIEKNLIWVCLILNGNSNVYRVYFYFLVLNVLDKFTITIP